MDKIDNGYKSMRWTPTPKKYIFADNHTVFITLNFPLKYYAF